MIKNIKCKKNWWKRRSGKEFNTTDLFSLLFDNSIECYQFIELSCFSSKVGKDQGRDCLMAKTLYLHSIITVVLNWSNILKDRIDLHTHGPPR